MNFDFLVENIPNIPTKNEIYGDFFFIVREFRLINLYSGRKSPEKAQI